MQNYKLTLCYDGTRYRGWQKQGNTAQTVQGKLETLLSRALDQPVEIAGQRPHGCRRPRENAGVLLPGRIRTSPARSFWLCSGNICRRISARSRSRKRRNGSTLAFRRCGKRIFTVSGTAMRPACLKESMCMRSRARWILTPCAAPRHSFAGGTNSLPFPPERKRPCRHAHDRGYRDRTLRGRSAVYVYRRRVLIQYGAHPDRHAARGRPRRAPSGRYGGDPCLAQPCECGFTAPAQGLFLWDVTY